MSVHHGGAGFTRPAPPVLKGVDLAVLKGYSSSVTYVQAAVICVMLFCATGALMSGRLTETAWVAIVGPIAGYVFGVHGTITGANGVAGRVQQAAEEAQRAIRAEGGGQQP